MSSASEFLRSSESMKISGFVAGGAESITKSQWKHTNPGAIEALQVVYKIAERCNINCSYCYYFNMGEDSALARPAYATLPVTERLAQWISVGCEQLLIPLVNIAFHGGEPTMIGVKAFDEACRVLRSVIEPVARVSLSVQTNGTLLNDEWLEVFLKRNVSVGISIDGPQADNDRFRLDRRGRSTFRETERAIVKLVEASASGSPLPSTISVIHPENDYRSVYRYLRNLGVQQMRFLLPDRNLDDTVFVSSGSATKYGDCLLDIFHAWLSEDNTNVQIKFFEQLLAHFRPDVDLANLSRRPRKANQVVIAHSDGTVGVDDTFIPALAWYEKTPTCSTHADTLTQFLAEPVFQEIEEISNSLPVDCARCRWQKVCKSGDMENRFSSLNGFDNPSVYCDAYKRLFEGVCGQLIANGYPEHLVTEKFGCA